MKNIKNCFQLQFGKKLAKYWPLMALVLLPGLVFSAAQGDITVTGQAVRGETTSSKFDEYRTVPRGIFVEDLSMMTEHEKSNCYIGIDAYRPGLEDQGFSLNSGKWGLMKLGVKYTQLIHNYTNTAKSFYVHDGQGRLQIPDRLQGSDVLTGGATIFSLVPSIPVKLRRDTFASSLSLTPLDRLDVNVSYSDEDQNGSKIRGFYLPLHEVAEPIKYNTRDVSASVGYAGNGFSTRLGYTASIFKNDIDELIVDNIQNINETASTPGRWTPGKLGIALPPDNQAHNVSLSGGGNLPFWNSRLNASASYGWMTQNDPFLPVSVNQALLNDAANRGVNLTPPKSSLEGKIRTMSANSTLLLKPAKPVSVRAKVNYYDHKNETDQLLFNNIARLDTLFSTATPSNGFNAIYSRRTQPVGYSKIGAGTDVSYQIIPAVGATVGYNWERTDREHREASRMDEHALSFSMNILPAKWMSLRPSYVRAKRYYGDYDADKVSHNTFPVGEGVGVIGQSPLLRKFDQANRIRNWGALKSSFFPFDNLTIDAEYNYRDDDYEDTIIGVQQELNHSYAVDVIYDVIDRLSLFGSYAREKNYTELHQRYRESGSATRPPLDLEANDWVAKMDDVTDSVGFGANGVIVKNKLDADVNLYFTRSRGQMVAFNPNAIIAPGTSQGQGNSQTTQIVNSKAIDFPETRAETQKYSASIKWHFLENLTARVRYEYERYIVSDFAFDTIQVWQPAWNTSIFLGATQDDYYAHIASVSLIYRFGS